MISAALGILLFALNGCGTVPIFNDPRVAAFNVCFGGDKQLSDTFADDGVMLISEMKIRLDGYRATVTGISVNFVKLPHIVVAGNGERLAGGEISLRVHQAARQQPKIFRNGPLNQPIRISSAALIGGCLPKVFDDDTDYDAAVFKPFNFGALKGYIRSQLAMGRLTSNIVRFAGFSEGSVNEPHAERAESYADDRRRSHDVGPQGGFALSGKVLLVALICAAFLACIGKATSLIDRGFADAGLSHLIVGIFGIMAGVIVGFPLIFGGYG